MNMKLKYEILRSDDEDKLKSEVEQFIKDKEVERILWTHSEIEQLYKAVVYYLIFYPTHQNEN